MAGYPYWHSLPKKSPGTQKDRSSSNHWFFRGKLAVIFTENIPWKSAKPPRNKMEDHHSINTWIILGWKSCRKHFLVTNSPNARLHVMILMMVHGNWNYHPPISLQFWGPKICEIVSSPILAASLITQNSHKKDPHKWNHERNTPQVLGEWGGGSLIQMLYFRVSFNLHFRWNVTILSQTGWIIQIIHGASSHRVNVWYIYLLRSAIKKTFMDRSIFSASPIDPTGLYKHTCNLSWIAIEHPGDRYIYLHLAAYTSTIHVGKDTIHLVKL